VFGDFRWVGLDGPIPIHGGIVVDVPQIPHDDFLDELKQEQSIILIRLIGMCFLAICLVRCVQHGRSDSRLEQLLEDQHLVYVRESLEFLRIGIEEHAEGPLPPLLPIEP